MNSANTHSCNNVDDFVEAYESARELEAQANFVDFLPSPDSKLYQSVAAEVIRVDMEYSWNSGQKMRLTEYQKIVPKALDDREVLGQVAFEEYRLRLRAGESVSSEEYRTRYGIDTDHWPREIASTDTTEDTTNVELMQEALVLADNVQNFPATGSQFLDFRLQQEIGRGAFARVYLAQQGELADRLVVLKIASGNSLEPQHLARLQHTNIVPIYSVHRQDDLTAVCMPFFGARTFADLLDTVRQKSGGLATEQNLISTFLNRRDPTQLIPSKESAKGSPPVASETRTLEILTKSGYVDAVVWLIKQVAEGISHAHERGIVHRDLKPANILLTDEGLPMVLDFNLSENVVVNGRTSLLVGGTLPYMAPEHLGAVSSGGKIGIQTDLFSLGVIFYELLTGRRPFPDRKGSFDSVVREMIVDRQAGYPSIRELNHSVPPSIAAVVERCLAPDIQDRYHTTDELTEDLGRHLAHQPLAHAPDRSVAERSKKWLRRHPRISSGAGVAAIAGVLLAVAAGLLLLRGQHLARLEAESIFTNFRQEQPSLYMALGVGSSERQVLQDSLSSTRQSLASYGVLEDAIWQERRAYHSLSALSREELDGELGQLLYLAARANEDLLSTATDPDERSALLNESLRLNRLAFELFTPAARPRALLLQQANLLELQGSAAAAETMRQRAADQPITNIIDQYANVYDLFDAHNYRATKPLLTTLRDRRPTDPVPWLLLGDTNAALDLLPESIGCYNTAVALWPKSYVAFFKRGLCHLQQKQYQDALADFEQVIALRPNLACGYLNRAFVYRALGQTKPAINDITKAIELDAPQTRVYFLRSELHRRAGNKDAAKRDFDQGMTLTPTDELSWVERGIARRKLDPKAALSDFEQALKLNPVSAKALRNSVHVLADLLDQPEEAMQAVDQLLAINEKDAEALASRSVLHARLGDRQAAVSDVQRLLRVSKKPKALFQAACTLSLTSGEHEADARKAMTLLASAVQAEPIWLYRAHKDPDLENLRQTEGFQKLVADSRKLSQMNLNLNKPAAATE